MVPRLGGLSPDPNDFSAFETISPPSLRRRSRPPPRRHRSIPSLFRPRHLGPRGAIAAVGLVATGCGGDDDVLQVYSGRHYGIEAAFEQFTDDTGIEVRFLTGNDAELRERIAAEGDEPEDHGRRDEQQL